MKNNLNYKSITTITLILCVIAIVSFYFYKNNIGIKRNNDVVASTDIPKITFISKSIYDYNKNASTTKVWQLVIDNKNDDTEIIKNRNAHYESVNKEIISDYTMSQCDPSDLAFSKENGGDVNSYASIWTASTTMLNRYIWSMHVVNDIYCGGAHPSYSSYGLNYLLDTNITNVSIANSNSEKAPIIIDLKYIFSNYLEHRSQINGMVLDRYFKTLNPKDDSECIDSIKGVTSNEYSDGVIPDFIKFTLDADGINIVSFGLPHVVASCEPSGYHIPYEVFGNLINPNFKQLLK